MDIVKFKDIILDDTNAPQLTPEQIELFNTKFRGKYVYNIGCTYCTPIEDMSEEDYINITRSLTIKQYIISWFSCGELISKSIVIEDNIPVYEGPTPTKPSDEHYNYVFTGWSPEITPATKDTIYTAVFNAIPIPNEYVVKFVDFDGTILQVSSVLGGNTAEYTGETPTRPDSYNEQTNLGVEYRFSSWSRDLDEPIIENTTIVAEYTEFSFEYVNAIRYKQLNASDDVKDKKFIFVSKDNNYIVVNGSFNGSTGVYNVQKWMENISGDEFDKPDEMTDDTHFRLELVEDPVEDGKYKYKMVNEYTGAEPSELYLGANNSKNAFTTSTVSQDDNNYLWNFDDNLYLYNVGKNTSYVQYNTSTPRFSIYSSIQNPAYIYYRTEVKKKHYLNLFTSWTYTPTINVQQIIAEGDDE